MSPFCVMSILMCVRGGGVWGWGCFLFFAPGKEDPPSFPFSPRVKCFQPVCTIAPPRGYDRGYHGSLHLYSDFWGGLTHDLRRCYPQLIPNTPSSFLSPQLR